MNAYELADQVEMWGEDLLALNMKGGIPVVQGAKMLRQQADRIAELEKRGKPVAWMFQGAFDISTYVSFEKPNPDIYPNPTPLYTAPQTKPLSDEEIDSIIYSVDWAYDPVLLARAIEERHGIK